MERAIQQAGGAEPAPHAVPPKYATAEQMERLIEAMGNIADPEVIGSAVDSWLDEHPEATTTVQDGSITAAKLAPAVAENVAAVPDLKSAIDLYESAKFTVKNAYIPNVAGADTSSQTRLCTIEFIEAKKGTIVSVDSGYKFRVAMYSGTTGSTYIKSNTSDYVTEPFALDADYYIRVTVGRTDNANIALSEATNLHINLYVPLNSLTDALSESVSEMAEKITIPFADADADDLGVVNKYIYMTGGMGLDSQTRIATETYIPVSIGDVVRLRSGYKARIAIYSGDTVDSFIKNNTNDYATADWVSDTNGFIRLTVAKANDQNISPSEIENVLFLSADDEVGNAVYKLNKELSNYFDNEIYPLTAQWEPGSFTSFTVGDLLTKNNSATYLSTRKRSPDPVNYKKPFYIEAKSGYKVNIFGVLNGRISSITGYLQNSVFAPGQYSFVLKADGDADISDVDAAEIVKIITGDGLNYNPDWFNRPSVYWRPPYYGAEYAVKTTVDSATYNVSTVPSTVIDAWENLAAESEGYLTYSVMGKDESGTFDIPKVSAVPTGYNAANRGTSKPKIILTAGVHGNEKESVFALYYLFYDIVHNWEQNKVLEYLRWNVIFEIMPLVNPWAFNASNTNNNVNGVNINHNFDDADHSIGYGEDDNPGDEGSAPFSEKETQYMKAVFDANEDAVYYVDFHTDIQSVRFTYHDLDPMYKTDRYQMDIANASIEHIDYIGRHWRDDYTHDTLEANRMYGGVVYNTLGGHAISYAMSLGIYGQVCECGGKLPGTTELYSNDNLRLAVQTFGQWLQIVAEYIYKIVNH